MEQSVYYRDLRKEKPNFIHFSFYILLCLFFLMLSMFSLFRMRENSSTFVLFPS